MPSNTTSTYNIFVDFLGIKNKYNFNLGLVFRGGYFAALGGSRGWYTGYEHHISAQKKKTQKNPRIFKADENAWGPESYKKKAE